MYIIVLNDRVDEYKTKQHVQSTMTIQNSGFRDGTACFYEMTTEVRNAASPLE